MHANRRSKPDAKPYEVQAHHLLCAVCRRGGCSRPPCGTKKIDALLAVLWSYPHTPLLIKADLDVSRAHFFDVYEKRKPKRLPADFADRNDSYSDRRKDLEVCRLLGIYPNTALPAIHAYNLLFARQPTLQGMCRGLSGDTTVWPECPHANKGYYEKISQAKGVGLKEQTERGEDLAGEGIWALFQPRTRKEMSDAKRKSAAYIVKDAKQLYIRPNHLLCILCRRKDQDPLVEDNLIELRKRMEDNPDIPVTLTEGCCMVCDPCNVYHPDEHVCYHAHPKNVLRDLRMLEILGLKPGATLPAREVYRLVFEKVKKLQNVCGWGDGSNTTVFWAPCGGWKGSTIEDAKAEGFLKHKR
jgi:hypothetical protein